MFGYKARRSQRQQELHTFGAVDADAVVEAQAKEIEGLRKEIIRLGARNSTLDRVNIEFATELLRKTAELRKVNIAIARRNRTIERLRKQNAEDLALPPLPEFARTKDGKAIYSHAYQMGRRKGRRDVADAIHLSASESAALMSQDVQDMAALGAEGAFANEGVEPQPEQDYGREHAH